MTQHGSFPGRPRGRRARQDSDVPEWQGYDATPQDQREFPDLAPIRPREARARDGRAQGGQPAGTPAGPGGAARAATARYRPPAATRRAASRRPAATAAGSTAAATRRPGQAGQPAGQGRPPWDGAAVAGQPHGRASRTQAPQHRLPAAGAAAAAAAQPPAAGSRTRTRRPGPSPTPSRRSPSAGTGAALTRATSGGRAGASAVGC